METSSVELCTRCGAPILEDFHCENGHARPAPAGQAAGEWTRETVLAALAAERERFRMHAKNWDAMLQSKQQELEQIRDRIEDAGLRGLQAGRAESKEQLAAAVEALEKALAELEDPSEYLGEVQHGYSADPKVIKSIRQTLARITPAQPAEKR